MTIKQKVRQLKRQEEQQWIAMDGVVAVGIGKVSDQLGIIISVAQNVDEVRKKIPKNIDGVPITIQQTGSLEAQ